MVVLFYNRAHLPGPLDPLLESLVGDSTDIPLRVGGNAWWWNSILLIEQWNLACF